MPPHQRPAEAVPTASAAPGVSSSNSFKITPGRLECTVCRDGKVYDIVVQQRKAAGSSTRPPPQQSQLPQKTHQKPRPRPKPAAKEQCNDLTANHDWMHPIFATTQAPVVACDPWDWCQQPQAEWDAGLQTFENAEELLQSTVSCWFS